MTELYERQGFAHWCVQGNRPKIVWQHKDKKIRSLAMAGLHACAEDAIGVQLAEVINSLGKLTHKQTCHLAGLCFFWRLNRHDEIENFHD